MKTLNEIVLEYMDEIYTLFDSSNDLKRMVDLKNNINKNIIIKEQLAKLSSYANNPYSENYINLRKELFLNPLISEYKNLENNLYYLILAINIKLKELLIEKKGCL